MEISEIIGWYGMAAILVAYFLNVWGVLSADSWIFLLLNLTGALGIVLISVQKKVWQTAGLNAVWAVIALVAIVRILIK